MKANRHTPPKPADVIDQAMAALRAAGVIDDPSPATRDWARQDAMTLEEMRTALAGGPSLVDLVDEQRGPKP
jgi:hypothetical protein